MLSIPYHALVSLWDSWDPATRISPTVPQLHCQHTSVSSPPAPGLSSSSTCLADHLLPVVESLSEPHMLPWELDRDVS